MNIIFVSTSQFGYNSDIYYLAKYLSINNLVSVICWDYNRPKVEFPNINVVYLSRSGNKMIRYFKFLCSIALYLNKYKFDVAVIKYFHLVSFVKLFCPRVKFLFDVRTATVSGNFFVRYSKDFLLRFESKFFRYKSIISSGLRDKLCFPYDSYILPLGAEDLSSSNRCSDTDTINLIYVGTLDDRDVFKTIDGMRICLDNMLSFNKTIKYYIIGTGSKEVIEKISLHIEDNNLGDFVELVGYVHHTALSKYIDLAHIGISFVPITEYFDNQPVTKTFEYLLSGIPVLATRTLENKKIINADNGVLINDDPLSFAEGLSIILTRLINGQINIDKNLYNNFSWSSIANDFENHIKFIVSN